MSDFQEFSFDSAADALVEEMPVPQEHAISQASAEQSDTPKDNDGNAFDPTLHASGRDGKGILTEKGTWRKRRGAGKKSEGSTLNVPQTAPVATAQETQARAGGSAAANLFIALGIGFGGPEWQPQKNEQADEKAMLESAFGDYFVAKGWRDLPPGLALTVACAFYALPRLQMPVTQKRIGGVFGRIKIWWINRKLKKEGLRAVPIDSDETDPRGLKRMGYKVIEVTQGLRRKAA